MKIKLVSMMALVAMFFVTTTFAQVAEPTTTSTGIPSKGQTQTPSTQAPTTPSSQKKKPQGKGTGDWSKEKGQKPTDGTRTGEIRKKGTGEVRGNHAEGDHKGTGEARGNHAEGDHKGTGEARGNHAEGDHKEHDGQVSEGHGEKGKMKKTENTPEGTEQKSMKDRKAKKNSN